MSADVSFALLSRIWSGGGCSGPTRRFPNSQTGTGADTGEPAVNALGAHEVRVYRLLWPLVRPHTRMLLHRIPQRQCPDDEHPCVNPEHFSYFTQRKPALRGWLNRDGTRSERRTTTGLPA